MKKFIICISIFILALIGAITFSSISYANSSQYDNDVLPENTKVNGIDCSGLTYEQAAAKITKEWNSKHIMITGQLNNEIASFTDFGCTYDIVKKLKNVKKNYIVFAAVNHFISTPFLVHIPMIIDSYSESFKDRVVSAPFLNHKDSTVSQDAYVDLSDRKFSIVPEVYGTKPDSEKFFKDLLHHIQTGEFRLIFDEKNYYTMPKVTSEDKALKDYQKYCRKYLKQKITYSMGEETFTISAETLSGLMKDDMSGTADEEAVNNYVSELASKYDNVGIERNFTSLSGKQIHVSGGTYGWTIDQEGEAKKLISDINSHKDVTRKPIYSEEGYGEYSRTVGNTYIDVDISRQVVKMYVNGTITFSSSCVTGCRANGTTTDTGTYYILNKVRNVVLRGDNVDGTEYESPVKYWLGVTWGGQGFHDADWRGSFGGSIWIYNGSHGCINMPPNRMPSLYNAAEVGMPVVVHY